MSLLNVLQTSTINFRPARISPWNNNEANELFFNKNRGASKNVHNSDVFTFESLRSLQDFSFSFLEVCFAV